MVNYEKLIAEIDEDVKLIKGLYDLAYTQYSLILFLNLCLSFQSRALPPLMALMA